LRPNSSRQQAQAAVTVLGERLAQAYPEQNAGMELPARVVPLRVREFGGWQQPVFISAVLFLLVGLVLLSACANIAGLLLARSAQRQREIAMRVALGATRGRLIRMLLTESLGLAVVGALTGAVLFVGLTRALSNVALPALLGAVNLQVGIDAGIIIYALGLTLLTGVLCGLIPALRVTRTNVVSEVARAGQSSTGRLWARHVFVVGQVAASMILLVLSSLLLLGLTRVTTLDPGFDIDRVAWTAVSR
jgi:putative ABC transport system permease protein